MSAPSIRELVGQRIREAREAAGMTQGQLGEIVGLTAAGVSRIEAAHRDTTASRLVAIVAALHLDLSDLFAPSAGPSVPGQHEDAA